jgi:hypothetical protein
MALVGLAATSCDPRRFDDLSEKTWVKIIEKPSRSKAFGHAAGAAPSSGDGATVFLAGSSKPSVLRVTVDAKGALSSTPFSADLGLEESSVPTAVLADARGNVYLGVADTDSQRGRVFAYGPTLATPRDMLANVTIPKKGKLGRALAFLDARAAAPLPIDAGILDASPADAAVDATPADAAVDATPVDAGPVIDAPAAVADAAAAPDAMTTTTEPTLVVLGDRAVVLIPIDKASTTPVRECQTASDIGAMVVARLSELGEDVIVLGLPGKTSDGSVRVLKASEIQGGTCPAGISLTLTDGGPTLGSALAIYDHDDDGALDIVASAPGAKKVFVFRELSQNSPSVIEAPDSLASDRFGTTLAVGNFVNADEEQELLIGDPSATVGGQAKAGRALLIDGDRKVLLHSVSPEEDARFASLLVAVPFGNGTKTQDLLLVGVTNQALLYFRVDALGTDPRE